MAQLMVLTLTMRAAGDFPLCQRVAVPLLPKPNRSEWARSCWFKSTGYANTFDWHAGVNTGHSASFGASPLRSAPGDSRLRDGSVRSGQHWLSPTQQGTASMQFQRQSTRTHGHTDTRTHRHGHSNTRMHEHTNINTNTQAPTRKSDATSSGTDFELHDVNADGHLSKLEFTKVHTF